MSYGYYTVLAPVNENNSVSLIGVNNTLQILPFKNLKEEDTHLLNKAQRKKLQDNDLMNIYCINKAIQLRKPYKLLKPCTNMRYTTPEETYHIKKRLIDDKKNLISIINNKYQNTYTENEYVDIEDINITEELKTITLDTYNSLNAKGQTKLI